MGHIKDIAKIDGKDFSEFTHNYLNTATPVILKGAISEWPAIKNWNPDYLTEKIGNHTVRYKKSETNVHPIPQKMEDTRPTESLFSEYLKTILSEDSAEAAKYCLSGDEAYFSNEGVTNPNFVSLLSDFSIPSFMDKNKIERIGFWVTSKNVSSWLHYDGGALCNINAQVRGKKTVYLFDPDESKNLYMFLAARGEAHHFSQVNYLNPDLDVFPKYKDANYFLGEIEAGDMLYIPKYWIHTFFHTGDLNINVNFWWKNNVFPLNSLSARDNFVEHCRNAYNLGGRTRENMINFKKLLSKNSTIQNVMEKVEKSFFLPQK